MTEIDSRSDDFSVANCAKLLSQLIEINTCQPAGNEARLVDFIEARYQNTSAQCTRLDHGHNRASLVVKLPGQSDTGTVAFVGHLDTVSCGDLNQWHSPPFAATVKDGVLFGRGASDMKGGVAAMLLALDHFINSHPNLQNTVLFCFTADEEKDGIGARALSQSGLLKDVAEMFVCEPSRESIGLCEKGALWVRVTASGVSCHASRPKLGVNAIEALIAFAAKARGTLDFSQDHPYLGKTSLSVTMLQGGTMTNIIPAAAFIELDIRTLPDVSHENLQSQFAEICRQLEREMPPLVLNLEIINNRPPLGIEESHEFVLKIDACAEKRSIRLAKRGLFFYTDASQLVPPLDIPFVILGPGDDREAHKANEQIQLESVARFARLYAGYIQDHCQ